MWARIEFFFLHVCTCLSFVLKHADGVCAAKRAEALDRKGLEKMMLRLEAVDLESVSRVSESKVQYSRP